MQALTEASALTEFPKRLIKAFWVFLLVALTGSIIGFVYILVMPRLSYTLLRIAACLGYAAILTLVANKTIKWTKLYSRSATVIAVFLGVIAVEYFKWNFFFAVNFIPFGLSSYEEGLDYNYLANLGYVLTVMKELVLSPLDFAASLSNFNRFGTWVYNNEPVYGAALWMIWGAETLVLFLLPVQKAARHENFKNFQGDTLRFLPVSFEAFEMFERDSAAIGDFRFLELKPLASEDCRVKGSIGICIDREFFTYEFFEHQTGEIGIYNMTKPRYKRGKKVKYTPVGEKISLTSDQIETLTSIVVSRRSIG